MRGLQFIARNILVFCLASAIVATSSLTADTDPVDFAKIEADLAGPVSLRLKNGNRQTGRVVSWDGETLRLAVQLGGGSAEMQFSADKIRDIAFPGGEYLERLRQWTTDPERSHDALALFRAFYKQRGPYLRYMDENEIALLVEYARFALEQDEPLMAISIINVLRPHIEDKALLESLDDAILLAFFLGGMKEEALTQAREWVETADPAGASALGWRILAEIHFREERYEEALWTALSPVAFANQMPTEHLDACYAFAIAAAEKTRQDTVKQKLHREMRQRNLAWPGNIPALADLEPEIVPAPEETEAAEGAEETDSQTGDAPGEESNEDATQETAPETTPPKSPDSLPSRLPQYSNAHIAPSGP